MTSKNHLICPRCQATNFEVKKEATYVYTYELDNPHSSNSNLTHEPLPFLFEEREMLSSDEYIQCKACYQQYYYDFTNNTIRGEFS